MPELDYVAFVKTNRPDVGGRALGDIGAAREGAVAFVLGLEILVIVRAPSVPSLIVVSKPQPPERGRWQAM